MKLAPPLIILCLVALSCSEASIDMVVDEIRILSSSGVDLRVVEGFYEIKPGLWTSLDDPWPFNHVVSTQYIEVGDVVLAGYPSTVLGNSELLKVNFSLHNNSTEPVVLRADQIKVRATKFSNNIEKLKVVVSSGPAVESPSMLFMDSDGSNPPYTVAAGQIVVFTIVSEVTKEDFTSGCESTIVLEWPDSNKELTCEFDFRVGHTDMRKKDQQSAHVEL